MVKAVLKLNTDVRIEPKIGPRIDPSPKTPVLMPLISFLNGERSRLGNCSFRTTFKAGTELLLMRMPPRPPMKMPVSVC